MLGSKRTYGLLWGLLMIVRALNAQPASAQATGTPPYIDTTDWGRYMVAARVAYGQGHYDEAEKQVKAALEYAKRFWPNDARTAQSLGLLGQIYRGQGKDAEAEKPFKEALAIWKEVFGPERFHLLPDDLAQLYQDEGKYAEAEPLFKLGITPAEKDYNNSNNYILAVRLDKLAGLYYAAGKYDKAEPLYKRALEVRKNVLGRDHLDVAQSLENYGKVLRKLNRVAEAEELEARAASIRKNR